MLIGPTNLLDLDSPKLVFEAPGIKVYRATHPEGGTYGEIIAQRGQASAMDFWYAVEHFHGGSLLRDTFTDTDDGTICINFWKDAA
jgi:hypothetical protein